MFFFFNLGCLSFESGLQQQLSVLVASYNISDCKILHGFCIWLKNLFLPANLVVSVLIVVTGSSFSVVVASSRMVVVVAAIDSTSVTSSFSTSMEVPEIYHKMVKQNIMNPFPSYVKFCVPSDPHFKL